jgi:DNA mismatch repair protein MLH3
MNPLPEQTVSLLRSSLGLSSISHVLLELVQNSIDAQSKSISILLEEETWSIAVLDDGLGIPQQLMHVLGTRRYIMESRRSFPDVPYGFRGETLASLAECAELEISSRDHQGESQRKKIFQNRSQLQAQIHLPQSVCTIVSVRNLFYNFPVKRIASDWNAEIERSKQGLMMISTINPDVAVTFLRKNSAEIFLRITRSSTIASKFRSLFNVSMNIPVEIVSISQERSFYISGNPKRPPLAILFNIQK